MKIGKLRRQDVIRLLAARNPTLTTDECEAMVPFDAPRLPINEEGRTQDQPESALPEVATLT